MRIPGMLKERVIEIAKAPELAKELFPLVRDVDKFQYAYAVYLAKQPVEIVFGRVTDTLPEGMRPGWSRDFRDFIFCRRPGSFMDLVFLLDFYFYNATRLHHMYDPNRLKFRDASVVYDVLKDSRGVLLWHYELENLIRLFITDIDKVTSLRKGINAERRSAYDIIAKHIQLDDKVSLADVITERMLFFNTCAPNFKGALLLWPFFED